MRCHLTWKQAISVHIYNNTNLNPNLTLTLDTAGHGRVEVTTKNYNATWKLKRRLKQSEQALILGEKVLSVRQFSVAEL